MEDVAARALRAAGKADPVYVVCDPLFPEGEKPAANTVVVPCLAACCPEFWTSLLTAGTEVSAVCDFDECASCAIAGEAAVDSYAASIETAQRWTGSSVRMAESAPVQTSLAREYGRNDASERRDVLKKIALDVTEAANGTRRAKTSSVLQDFHARQERLRLTVRQSTSGDKALSSLQPDGGKKKIRTPRRTMLFRAARTARGALDALEVPVSVTDEDACTGEAECVEACPRGARSVHGGSASVDPEVCVGCGMCAKACPRAAAATKAVPLGRLLANAAQTRQDGADGPFVNG